MWVVGVILAVLLAGCAGGGVAPTPVVVRSPLGLQHTMLTASEPNLLVRFWGQTVNDPNFRRNVNVVIVEGDPAASIMHCQQKPQLDDVHGAYCRLDGTADPAYWGKVIFPATMPQAMLDQLGKRGKLWTSIDALFLLALYYADHMDDDFRRRHGGLAALTEAQKQCLAGVALRGIYGKDIEGYGVQEYLQDARGFVDKHRSGGLKDTAAVLKGYNATATRWQTCRK